MTISGSICKTPFFLASGMNPIKSSSSTHYFAAKQSTSADLEAAPRKSPRQQDLSAGGWEGGLLERGDDAGGVQGEIDRLAPLQRRLRRRHPPPN
jgi:hypothetical protein